MGLEIARSSSGIVLTQHQYTLQILSDAGFLDSKPVKTPMNPRISLSLDDGDLLTDSTAYRHLIGRLLYLTITRPDITYAVHALSQFVHSPTTTRLQAVHHILCYIKSNPGLGLFSPSCYSTQLRAFCDVD